MILRIPVDPDAMRGAAESQRETFLAIADHSKANGAIHHEFWAGEGEVLAVDEWESPEAFQAFFEAKGAEIGQLMAAAGAGEATPSFYTKMPMGDEF